jgi:spore maturation protein CgeB
MLACAMRILIVDTCYPAFLAGHYAQHPQLTTAAYEEQWRALMDTFFGTADSYSYHLGLLGHEAREVIANCRELQYAWAQEQGLRTHGSSGRGLEADIVIAQAQAFAPDVIYVQDLRYFPTRVLRRLKSISGFLVGQVGSEPPSPRRLRTFDLLLTSFPHFVERLTRIGVAARYFRIGFDARIIERLERCRTHRYGAVFVGALSGRKWRSGNGALARAAEQVAIDFWGYGASRRLGQSALRRSFHGDAWGLDMFRILHSSRIALNRHGDIAEDFANNMRLYEATGVGTMLLTDAKRNLGDLFEVGREVVAYDGINDLIDKIRYYLAHHEEREQVARAGQKRTLREHTYLKRMCELNQMIVTAISP